MYNGEIKNTVMKRDIQGCVMRRQNTLGEMTRA